MNTYLVVSSLLNFCAGLIAALGAFITGRRNAGVLAFGCFALAVSTWSGAYCLWRLAATTENAAFLCRLLMFGAILIPVTLLHFAQILTGHRNWRLLIGSYVCAAALTIADFGNGIVGLVGTVDGLAFWPKAGPVFPAFLIYFYALIAVSFAHLLSRKAGLAASTSNRKFIVFIFTIGFLGGSTNFPLWYGIPIPPVGNGLVCVYLIIVGYAATKYRLQYARLDFVRGGVIVGLGSIIAGLCVLAAIAISEITGIARTAAQLTEVFFYALLISAVSLWAGPMLVGLAERILERSLLRERFKALDRLKDLLHAVGSEEDEAALFHAVANRLSEAFSAKTVAIYFRGDMDPVLRLRASVSKLSMPAELPEEHIVVRRLVAEPRCLSIGYLELTLGPAPVDLITAMEEYNIELAAPMTAEGRLVGVLLLNRAPAMRDESDAVLSVLETMTQQLTVAIMARRLERRVNHSSKLIAIGTLAAGLAHELRNPITSITTFSELTDAGMQPANNPEFMRVVLRDTRRISSIVESVSAYATSETLVKAAVRVRDVLTAAVEVVQSDAKKRRVPIHVLGTAEGLVQANTGQLQQVFINIINNAVQAIDEGNGQVTIYVTPITLADGRCGVRIMIQDTGPGIPPDLLPLIFEPFVTTKATGDRQERRGLGLGLAITKRIIEAHDGDIQVQSTVGVGTTFMVYLPATKVSEQPTAST